MAKRAFSTNIAGRVKKIRTDNFLVPLFEAISNSIHSIESLGVSPGSIEVKIIRNSRQLELDTTSKEGQAPITGFSITDNGQGFNASNMASFLEADSFFKLTIGGKGVGRFSWLKFFEKATIESVYEEGAERRRVNFSFSLDGVDDAPPELVTSERYTAVTIEPLRAAYEAKTRKTIEHIAVALIEHFIVYLVRNTLPGLIIRDGSAKIDINDYYRTSIGTHEIRKELTINGTTFKTTGIKFYLGNHQNTAYLCGDKRVAEKIELGKRDPFLSKRFFDQDLRAYSYLIFVESDYLNGIVNDDRDGFHFPEPGSLAGAIDEVVLKNQLLDDIVKLVQSDMNNEIVKLKETNLNTIREFVGQDAPQYRYLINKHPESVSTIHDSDPAKIDLALRRIQFEEEMKTRAEITKLIRTTEVVGSSATEEWKQKYDEVFARLNEEGKANLAGYIVKRGLILELLKRRIEKEDGVNSREDAIHKLIFPMITTSDEVSYEQQNLWIIDERLSYHYYLASDKPLSTMPPAEASSAKEPDIAIFDYPIALNDRPESERMESIVIIEFKRPCESPVRGPKNPVDQIQEYILKIKRGRAETRKGRPLTVTDTTYFYGYAICEIDQSLKDILAGKGMNETPDGRGMYGFFATHKAYIEVISYDKLLSDAHKRNQILFDKLQMPLRRS